MLGRAMSGSDSSTRSLSMTSASMMVASMWLNFSHFLRYNKTVQKLKSIKLIDCLILALNQFTFDLT